MRYTCCFTNKNREINMPKDSSDYCYISKVCFAVDEIYFHLLQRILFYMVYDRNILINLKCDTCSCIF